MKKESHFWAALLISETRIFYRHNSETDYAISQGGLDLRVTYSSPANCSKKRLWKVYRLVIQYSAWFKKFVKIMFFIYCWLCWFFIAAGLFSACGKQGLLSSYANGLLIAVASVPEQRLSGSCSAWAQTFQLLGSRAQARWLGTHSMWDLPGLGIEPFSPALAHGFFTTEPLGKPWKVFLVEQ